MTFIPLSCLMISGASSETLSIYDVCHNLVLEGLEVMSPIIESRWLWASCLQANVTCTSAKTAKLILNCLLYKHVVVIVHVIGISLHMHTMQKLKHRSSCVVCPQLYRFSCAELHLAVNYHVASSHMGYPAFGRMLSTWWSCFGRAVQC